MTAVFLGPSKGAKLSPLRDDGGLFCNLQLSSVGKGSFGMGSELGVDPISSRRGGRIAKTGFIHNSHHRQSRPSNPTGHGAFLGAVTVPTLATRRSRVIETVGTSRLLWPFSLGGEQELNTVTGFCGAKEDLEYEMSDGRRVELSSESEEACVEDCKNAPQFLGEAELAKQTPAGGTGAKGPDLAESDE